jgi:hypothetical protein
MYITAVMVAPYHSKCAKKEKRIMVPNPSIKPTKGRNRSIEAKTSFFERSSLFLKFIGNIEKNENENFKPR